MPPRASITSRVVSRAMNDAYYKFLGNASYRFPLFDTKLFVSYFWRMHRPIPPSAQRLMRLEIALEGPDRGAATRMARRLNVTIQRWWNVTRGNLPLSRGLTEIIVRRIPGITSDWLQYGRPEGLSLRIAKELRIGDAEGQDGGG